MDTIATEYYVIVFIYNIFVARIAVYKEAALCEGP